MSPFIFILLLLSYIVRKIYIYVWFLSFQLGFLCFFVTICHHFCHHSVTICFLLRLRVFYFVFFGFLFRIFRIFIRTKKPIFLLIYIFLNKFKPHIVIIVIDYLINIFFVFGVFESYLGFLYCSIWRIYCSIWRIYCSIWSFLCHHMCFLCHHFMCFYYH